MLFRSHAGSAGVLVLTPEALHLLVDFRYRESARACQESPAACPGLRVWDVPASYDEALLACLAEIGASTVGFEAAHVSVARHEYWRAAVESPRSDVTFRATDRVAYILYYSQEDTSSSRAGRDFDTDFLLLSVSVGF